MFVRVCLYVRLCVRLFVCTCLYLFLFVYVRACFHFHHCITLVTNLRSGAAGSKKTLKKEIADPQALVTMEEFHKRSFFYSYMLNFSSSLQQACDLSQVN